ncbi:LOW QUALITY PROTEIN: AT-rich interactive domain-containing protein 3A-like [Centruroides vittatus]|uniref:LOW QUALITY PROTEIN: AT-rich interactive domain-containing protein 3A-like n=1 Tax=Centruroides vittatus TaxID=120091 RepID=UPI000C6DA527|nr:AT-rich interactive domain-containing protein 3A-like isoform X2 [Centruroides sculpturatus]
MDHNESDLDGSVSNPDDDELNDSEYDYDDDGTDPLRLARVKMEEPDLLSRFERRDLEERADLEIRARNDQILREAASSIHRQAAAGMGSAGGSAASSPSLSPTGYLLPARDQQRANHLPPGYPSAAGAALAPSAASLCLSPSTVRDSQDHQKYTYEEQFKQLYELTEDPKRKEFLDDLFNFMQQRGTPVNRIPIMAKQVLDLYELYRLVVARGGLVEVINKKIWREITKGLNLPSSITSAAFTLRTQYMKYLYPYECEKEKLSTPEELQSAIDGNRRESRRSNYGPYPEMVSMPRNSHHLSPLSLVSRQVNGHSSTQGINSSGEEDNCSIPSTPTHITMPQQEALNLEVPRNIDQSSKSIDTTSRKSVEESSPPPKRFLSDEERLLNQAGVPSAHIKISSRGDGRSQIDSSLVVSMEINGIMYQGVLFAQSHRNRIA